MISVSTPEKKGIPNEYISNFYNALESRNIPVHSVILYKDDSVISEKYYPPYKKGELHRLFSISKSVTALAIGLLAEAGKLSLDDHIVDYFPDKISGPVHPWLAEMTIRDMLMMRTCHAQSTYDKYDIQSDWVGSFFSKTPTHKSGTIFHYDTSAAHVLAALVERLSGIDLWDYFRSELSELDLSAESYILKDGHGISMGGTGLVATPEDMLKIGILLLDKGMYNGKRLISEKFITEATSLLTPNCIAAPLPSEGSGYGYMIWHTEKDGFACYGMGGQLMIVQPQQRLILVTTCDTQGLSGANQVIYNSFYEEILNLEDKSNKELSSFFARFNNTDSLCYTFTDGYGVPISSDPCHKFTSMKLQANQMTLYSDSKEYVFPFSFTEYEASVLTDYNLKCYSHASLPDEHTLYIKTSIIDYAVGSIHFQIYFGENEVVLYMKKIEETMLNEYNGHYYGVKNET